MNYNSYYRGMPWSYPYRNYRYHHFKRGGSSNAHEVSSTYKPSTSHDASGRIHRGYPYPQDPSSRYTLQPGYTQQPATYAMYREQQQQHQAAGDVRYPYTEHTEYQHLRQRPTMLPTQRYSVPALQTTLQPSASDSDRSRDQIRYASGSISNPSLIDPHPPSQQTQHINKRPKLTLQPLRVDVREPEIKREPAYTPQVEAISPTLPPEDNAANNASKEILSHISKVDRDIANVEGQINKLKKKQQQQEEASAKPPEERPSIENLPVIDTYNQQSIAQLIYAENRRKAEQAHAQFDKLGPRIELPLYNQPSDTAVYRENKRNYQMFKKRLVLFFKKRQQARKIRERYLTERYDQLMQTWLKKMERIENNVKRRAKDAKTRELFEKVFPEVKKIREDKERFSSRVGTRNVGIYARSEAELEQIMDGLHEQEEEEKKMRNDAVIPPMMLDARQRKLRFDNRNGLIEDPMAEYKERQNINVWTPQERHIFKEKYLQHPKNFTVIASYLERKSVSDCVQYYYDTKRTDNYKQLLRKQNVKKRRQMQKAQAQMMKEEPKQEELPLPVVEIPPPVTEEEAPTVETTEAEVETRAEGQAEVKWEADTEMGEPTVKVEGGIHNCAICKCELEHYGLSRPLTKANYQLYGLNGEELVEGMRVCSGCRCRSVRRRYTHCPIPSCKTPKRKVKRLRPLPSKWLDLPADEKELISTDLQITETVTKCCSACFNRIARRLGNSPSANQGLPEAASTAEEFSWTPEEIALMKQCLSTKGRDWLYMATIIGTRSELQCKTFYYNAPDKQIYDDLVHEYKRKKVERQSARTISTCESVASTATAHSDNDVSSSSDEEDNERDDSDTTSAPSPSPLGDVKSPKKEEEQGGSEMDVTAGVSMSAVQPPINPLINNEAMSVSCSSLRSTADNDSSATASADEGPHSHDPGPSAPKSLRLTGPDGSGKTVQTSAVDSQHSHQSRGIAEQHRQPTTFTQRSEYQNRAYIQGGGIPRSSSHVNGNATTNGVSSQLPDSSDGYEGRSKPACVGDLIISAIESNLRKDLLETKNTNNSNDGRADELRRRERASAASASASSGYAYDSRGQYGVIVRSADGHEYVTQADPNHQQMRSPGSYPHPQQKVYVYTDADGKTIPPPAHAHQSGPPETSPHSSTKPSRQVKSPMTYPAGHSQVSGQVLPGQSHVQSHGQSHGQAHGQMVPGQSHGQVLAGQVQYMYADQTGRPSPRSIPQQPGKPQKGPMSPPMAGAHPSHPSHLPTGSITLGTPVSHGLAIAVTRPSQVGSITRGTPLNRNMVQVKQQTAQDPNAVRVYDNRVMYENVQPAGQIAGQQVVYDRALDQYYKIPATGVIYPASAIQTYPNYPPQQQQQQPPPQQPSPQEPSGYTSNSRQTIMSDFYTAQQMDRQQEPTESQQVSPRVDARQKPATTAAYHGMVIDPRMPPPAGLVPYQHSSGGVVYLPAQQSPSSATTPERTAHRTSPAPPRASPHKSPSSSTAAAAHWQQQQLEKQLQQQLQQQQQQQQIQQLQHQQMLSRAAGHPQTGHPSTGHTSTGHPSTGHPSTGHPSTGHPPTGHAPTGHPSTGHPPTGHPSSNHPPTGHPTSAHPPSSTSQIIKPTQMAAPGGPSIMRGTSGRRPQDHMGPLPDSTGVHHKASVSPSARDAFDTLATVAANAKSLAVPTEVMQRYSPDSRQPRYTPEQWQQLQQQHQQQQQGTNTADTRPKPDSHQYPTDQRSQYEHTQASARLDPNARRDVYNLPKKSPDVASSSTHHKDHNDPSLTAGNMLDAFIQSQITKPDAEHPSTARHYQRASPGVASDSTTANTTARKHRHDDPSGPAHSTTDRPRESPNTAYISAKVPPQPGLTLGEHIDAIITNDYSHSQPKSGDNIGLLRQLNVGSGSKSPKPTSMAQNDTTPTASDPQPSPHTTSSSIYHNWKLKRALQQETEPTVSHSGIGEHPLRTFASPGTANVSGASLTPDPHTSHTHIQGVVTSSQAVPSRVVSATYNRPPAPALHAQLADHRVQSSDQRIPSVEPRIVSDQRIQSSDQRIQSSDQRIQSSDQRMQSDQRIQSSDQRIQSSDQRIQSSDQRIQSSDQRIVSDQQRIQSDQRIQSSDQRIQSSDQRIQSSTDPRVQYVDPRAQMSDQRVQSSDHRVRLSDVVNRVVDSRSIDPQSLALHSQTVDTRGQIIDPRVQTTDPRVLDPRAQTLDPRALIDHRSAELSQSVDRRIGHRSPHPDSGTVIDNRAHAQSVNRSHSADARVQSSDQRPPSSSPRAQTDPRAHTADIRAHSTDSRSQYTDPRMMPDARQPPDHRPHSADQRPHSADLRLLTADHRPSSADRRRTPTPDQRNQPPDPKIQSSTQPQRPAADSRPQPSDQRFDPRAQQIHDQRVQYIDPRTHPASQSGPPDPRMIPDVPTHAKSPVSSSVVDYNRKYVGGKPGELTADRGVIDAMKQAQMMVAAKASPSSSLVDTNEAIPSKNPTPPLAKTTPASTKSTPVTTTKTTSVSSAKTTQITSTKTSPISTTKTTQAATPKTTQQQPTTSNSKPAQQQPTSKPIPQQPTPKTTQALSVKTTQSAITTTTVKPTPKPIPPPSTTSVSSTTSSNIAASHQHIKSLLTTAKLSPTTAKLSPTTGVMQQDPSSDKISATDYIHGKIIEAITGNEAARGYPATSDARTLPQQQLSSASPKPSVSQRSDYATSSTQRYITAPESTERRASMGNIAMYQKAAAEQAQYHAGVSTASHGYATSQSHHVSQSQHQARSMSNQYAAQQSMNSQQVTTGQATQQMPYASRMSSNNQAYSQHHSAATQSGLPPSSYATWGNVQSSQSANAMQRNLMYQQQMAASQVVDSSGKTSHGVSCSTENSGQQQQQQQYNETYGVSSSAIPPGQDVVTPQMAYASQQQATPQQSVPTSSQQITQSKKQVFGRQRYHTEAHDGVSSIGDITQQSSTSQQIAPSSSQQTSQPHVKKRSASRQRFRVAIDPPDAVSSGGKNVPPATSDEMKISHATSSDANVSRSEYDFPDEDDETVGKRPDSYMALSSTTRSPRRNVVVESSDVRIEGLPTSSQLTSAASEMPTSMPIRDNSDNQVSSGGSENIPISEQSYMDGDNRVSSGGYDAVKHPIPSESNSNSEVSSFGNQETWQHPSYQNQGSTDMNEASGYRDSRASIDSTYSDHMVIDESTNIGSSTNIDASQRDPDPCTSSIAADNRDDGNEVSSRSSSLHSTSSRYSDGRPWNQQEPVSRSNYRSDTVSSGSNDARFAEAVSRSGITDGVGQSWVDSNPLSETAAVSTSISQRTRSPRIIDTTFGSTSDITTSVMAQSSSDVPAVVLPPGAASSTSGDARLLRDQEPAPLLSSMYETLSDDDED